MDAILRYVQIKDDKVLVLRKPTIDDAERLIEYLNLVGGESDNLLFGKNEFHLSVEEEEEFIQRTNSDPNSIMVLGIIDGNIVSIGQISALKRKRVAHNSELAISVRKDYWGLGIGSAVMEELIRFTKDHPVIKNISLEVKADNIKAIQLYEKYGFEKVGIHKNFFHINGKFYDEILMDLSLD